MEWTPAAAQFEDPTPGREEKEITIGSNIRHIDFRKPNGREVVASDVRCPERAMAFSQTGLCYFHHDWHARRPHLLQ